MEPLRKCTQCGKEAWTRDDLEEFSKDKRRKYGRGSTCNECENKRKAEWKERREARKERKAEEEAAE